MRLPWPFGRRTPSDGPSEAAPEGPAPAAPGLAPSTASGPGPGLAAPTGAWAQLPPIQRASGGPPVVAPSAPFLDAVPGHHPLPPIVTPLGHDTGPAAPAGLVLARPAAVPSLTASTPMPTRPVQRRAAAAAAAGPAWDASGAWSDAAAGPPVRSLPSVSPGATVTPSSRPLTSAPAIAASAQQRSPASSSSAPGPASASIPRTGLPGTGPATPASAPGTSGAAPLPAPRGTPPARTASRWAESPSTGMPPAGLGAPLASTAGTLPATATPSTTSPVAGSSSAGSSFSPGSPEAAGPRRAGLGVPMSSPPAGTIAQRMPMATPPGRRAMPDVPARAAASASGPSVGGASASGASSAPGGPVAAPAAPAAPRPLPVLPVSRRGAGSGAGAVDLTAHDLTAHDHAGASHGAPSPRPGALPVARLASASGSAAGPSASTARARTTVPTLGSRPLRPSVARDGAGHGAEGATSPALPAPVAARWSGGSELPATVETLPATASSGDPVPLQRLAAGSGTGAAAASAASSGRAPREIVFPPRDGLAGGPLAAAPGAGSSPVAGPGGHATPGRQPLGSAAPLQRSAAGAEPGLPGFAAAPVSRAVRPPEMTLHHAPTPAPVHVTQAAPAQAPAMQRIVADTPAAAPTIGASRPGGGGTLPGITATPVVQRIDGGAPEPGGAPGGHSDTELDELARALFGRFRTHLRNEVIHEREAKGLGFDAF